MIILKLLLFMVVISSCGVKKGLKSVDQKVETQDYRRPIAERYERVGDAEGQFLHVNWIE